MYSRPVLGSGVEVYVNPLSRVVEIDDTFTLYVKIGFVMNLYGYEFKLGFNNTVLSCSSLGKGGFFPDSNIYIGKQEVNNDEGYAYFVIILTYPETAKTGAGTLAELSFSVLGEGESVIDLYDVNLSDENAESILHTTIDGLVTVTEENGDDEPDDNGALPIPLKEILFDISVSSIKDSLDITFFSLSRETEVSLYVVNTVEAEGDVRITWNVVDVNSNETVKSAHETVYYDPFQAQTITITFEIPEGDYMFYAKIESIAGEELTEIASTFQTFSVQNMWLVLIYDYHIIIIISVACIIGLGFGIHVLRKRRKRR